MVGFSLEVTRAIRKPFFRNSSSISYTPGKQLNQIEKMLFLIASVNFHIFFHLIRISAEKMMHRHFQRFSERGQKDAFLRLFPRSCSKVYCQDLMIISLVSMIVPSKSKESYRYFSFLYSHLHGVSVLLTVLCFIPPFFADPPENLELQRLRRPRERNHIPNIRHTRHIHDHTVEAETETGVFHTAVFPKGRDTTRSLLPPFPSLPYGPSVPRGVLLSGCLRRFLRFPASGDPPPPPSSVIVETHIKRLDFFRIIRNKNRPFKNFVCQITFVLRL